VKASSDLILDDAPGDLVDLAAGLLHGLLSHQVETHDVVHHPHSLVEGTVTVVLGERVLLQEVFSDHLSHF